MGRTASRASLHDLHRKLTEQFVRRLDEDEEEKLFTDAATLSAMIKLLKDNEITADPESNDGLKDMQSGLEDQVARMRAERAAKRAKALELAEKDLKALEG